MGKRERSRGVRGGERVEVGRGAQKGARRLMLGGSILVRRDSRP